MRATVTIQDELFDEADRVARTLGISRSRLFQEALARYLKGLREKALTEQANQHVLEHGTQVDSSFKRYVAKAWAEDMGDDGW